VTFITLSPEQEEKKPSNVCGWGLVLALGAACIAYLVTPSDYHPALWAAFVITNIALVAWDAVRNDEGMLVLLLLLVVGAFIAPFWLWLRQANRKPFWAYVSIVLLIFVYGTGMLATPGESAARPATPQEDAPVAAAAKLTSVATASAVEPEPTTSSAWSVSTQIDKLTDRETLKAVTRAVVPDNIRLQYELTLRCDGQTRVAHLGVFEDIGAGVVPRMLPFETRVSGDSVIALKRFSFRHDSGAVQSGTLVGGHGQDANTAAWGEWTVTFQDESARISSWNTSVANARAGKVAYIDAHTGAGRTTPWATLLQLRPDISTVPPTRLVVADVFPNETVEFSFSTLTSAERGAIESACFPPLPAMAAVPKPPAGTPLGDLPDIAPWDQLDPAPAALSGQPESD